MTTHKSDCAFIAYDRHDIGQQPCDCGVGQAKATQHTKCPNCERNWSAKEMFHQGCGNCNWPEQAKEAQAHTPGLPPCPFCFSEDVGPVHRTDVIQTVFIECKNCSARGPEKTYLITEHEAAETHTKSVWESATRQIHAALSAAPSGLSKEQGK